MKVVSTRVLISDDEADIRVLLEEICESIGFETRVVGHNSEVLSAAEQFSPEVILLDLQQNPSGVKVIKQLRQAGYQGRIYIDTGYPDDASFWGAIREKGNGLIGKPYMMDTITVCLRSNGSLFVTNFIPQHALFQIISEDESGMRVRMALQAEVEAFIPNNEESKIERIRSAVRLQESTCRPSVSLRRLIQSTSITDMITDPTTVTAVLSSLAHPDPTTATL